MEETEPLILAIETGSVTDGIALLKGDVVVDHSGDVVRAELLLSRIALLFETASVGLSDLNKIAVSIGPGSFTGIRIGIATALGLQRSCGVEVAGVNALEAIASLSNKANDVAAVMPVGRGRFAIQSFRRSEGLTVPVTDASTMSEQDTLDSVRSAPNTRFIVAAAEASQLTSKIHEDFLTNVTLETSNLATLIGQFARFHEGSPLEPLYLTV